MAAVVGSWQDAESKDVMEDRIGAVLGAFEQLQAVTSNSVPKLNDQLGELLRSLEVTTYASEQDFVFDDGGSTAGGVPTSPGGTGQDQPPPSTKPTDFAGGGGGSGCALCAEAEALDGCEDICLLLGILAVMRVLCTARRSKERTRWGRA